LADTNNIKAGEGVCSFQYEGEAEPTDVGFCRNCDMDFKTDSFDIEDGLNQAPIDNLESKKLAGFEIELIEANMRNLVAAMGGTPADIDEDTEPGTLIYKPTNSLSAAKFCEIIYKVKQVKDKTKQDIYTFFRAKVSGGVKFSHRKNKELFFKCKFMAYADPGNDGAPYQVQYGAPVE